MAESTDPTPSTLAEVHDLLLFDLDGVVYVGEDAVPGAVDAIGRAYDDGRAIGYATNNASRTDAEVAEHLSSFGLRVAPQDVVTSPQAAMLLLERHVAPGDPVMVVGGQGIVVELEARGWRVVRSSRACAGRSGCPSQQSS